MPGIGEQANVPLLEGDIASTIPVSVEDGDEDNEEDQLLSWRVWKESKKLWHIAGPTIFGLLASYCTLVITQAFAGHLGSLDLAAISLAFYVIVNFNFDLAEAAGVASMCLIPFHISFAIQFPLQRFLQSQLKTGVIAWVSLAALIVHVTVSWLFVYRLELGLVGTAISLNFAMWVMVIGLSGYTFCGGCPLTWSGFSVQAFSGLWEFIKLSVASGVMLCLESWYSTLVLLVTGSLKNAETAVDALSICMSINGWEMMISFGFFGATGVRVANELGAGNGRAAKFATKVSVVTSATIGFTLALLIVILHNDIALIFSSSKLILQEVNKLSVLLAIAILLNSVQPVLSGVAVGSGWQSYVAYINLGCYYLIGLPLGYVMGWEFHKGVMVCIFIIIIQNWLKSHG
ncbi:hypothetical protein FEM48_Zijuj08G0149200 [Ziziphus jujuba var. spinosa]|uniref:Protein DETOXIFICATION 27-like n=1 Tax=Ziziphus jujuba var. spinosa TaxID=714518 RepID=A0A978UZS3_ZIZJJ|nr:hypothetical protein FEM48_Zijuj08G0149200 [Ziziphus jujuba var. spinosa]